ncbi:MAG: ankyrin repeat domain-containing protein [Acidimicrobiales bacterium]
MQRTFAVPVGRLLSVAPGMPVTEMARAVEHYRRLGFSIWPADAETEPGVEFAIATRDGIELHFAVKRDHDPARTATWVFIGVEDADALKAEFDAAGVGQDRPVRDTDYKMRQFAHIDPDGNLLLFGSPLPHGTAPASAGTSPPTSATPAAPAPVDAIALRLMRAVKQGDVPALTGLLEEDPGLASSWTNSCTPLHHFANAPGHRPNPTGVVRVLAAAGADLNAHVRDSWHHETALHWAASNDDIDLIDALLDAGADIEHPGSSIGGGAPIQSAIGYGQWAAAKRLWERGAKIGLSHAAAFGEIDLVRSFVEADPPPDADDLSLAFWNACRAGRRGVAEYLLGKGADRDWQAPWDGNTPLDAALAKHEGAVVAWLHEIGARTGVSG